MSERRPDATDQAGDDQPEDEAGLAGRRRATWSRRIAIGVLVLFLMFVLWNVVSVVLLAYRTVIESQGGPL